MSLARIALPVAALAAAAGLWITPAPASPVAAPPAAIGTSSPVAPALPGKPAEVRTVGTTPPILTAAERLKLALAEREWAKRRTRPAAASRPAAIAAPDLQPKWPPFETRVPATGPRVRTKPIQGVREVMEGEKGGGR